jgi:ribonuclease P protein component
VASLTTAALSGEPNSRLNLASKRVSKGIGKRVGRLSGRNRYGAILAKRRSARGAHLQVYAGETTEDVAMLGVGVAKAVAKHASARNYMRRALREELRQYAPALAAVEIVILVRKAFDRAARRLIAEELSTLLGQLQLCAAP